MGNKRVIISRRLGRLGWIESVERVRRREGEEENKYVKRERERESEAGRRRREKGRRGEKGTGNEECCFLIVAIVEC